VSQDSLLVVAGEASGDAHGAKVLARLKQTLPHVQAFGLGGRRLIAQGLTLCGDPACLNIVGLSEVVPSLSRIYRLRSLLLKQVALKKPRACLLIDLPGFNLNLAAKLKKMGLRVIYYIAPQAWAWRQGRVYKLQKRVDRLCVIFPFEKEFFDRFSVPVDFVGHPLMENPLPPVPSAGAGKRVALLPGSRPKELKRLLVPMVQAARLLKQRDAELEFVLPVADGLDKRWIEKALDAHGVRVRLVAGDVGKAVAGARLALVTSGTATLETALAQVPMVVVYKASRTTRFFADLMLRCEHICIVNILARRRLVPELLQDEVRPKKIAAAAWPLLCDETARHQMLLGMQQVIDSLGQKQPSLEVARFLATCFGAKP
jgi:lipid-A-disaccharide synthase